MRGLLFFVLLLAVLRAGAQPVPIIYGQVLAGAQPRPIPFALVQTWPGARVFVADARGEFAAFAVPTIDSVRVWAPGYQVNAYYYFEESTPMYPVLAVAENRLEPVDDARALTLLRQVQRSRTTYGATFTPYAEHTYTKMVASTDSLENLVRLVKPLVRRFTRKLDSMQVPLKNVVLIEQLSQITTYNPLRKQEEVEAVSLSGASQITTPLPLGLLNSDHLQRDFVTINGSLYANVLAGQPTKRYHFRLAGAYKDGADSLYVLEFFPRNPKNAEVVSGYLVTSSRHFLPIGIVMKPRPGDHTHQMLALTFGQTDVGWRTLSQHAGYLYRRLPGMKGDLDVSLERYFFRQNNNTKPRSAITLDYTSTASNDSVQAILAGQRAVGLSAEDSVTRRFFDKVGNIRYFDQLVTIGGRLSQGEIQLNRWRLDLYNTIRVNYFETVRLGLGAHVLLNPEGTQLLGGYLGFGVRDRLLKYGADMSWPLAILTEGRIKAYTSNDLVTPGLTEFVFEERERYGPTKANLRNNLFTPRYDYSRQAGGQITARYSTYSQLGLRIRAVQNEPLYDYGFRDAEITEYNYAEAAAEWRLAYGERLLRFQRITRSLGSRYPVLLLQLARGNGFLSKRNFGYWRLDSKADWQARILGLGLFKAQLAAGAVSSSVPFAKLFSAKGSFGQISNNSVGTFETMGFNEFAASEYAHLFIRHQFGRWYWADYPFRPYLTLVHNMGWGRHPRPQEHQGLVVGTYAKGYYESGINIDDLYVFDFSVARIGIGVGFYARYGPYSRREPSENYFTKLIYNITI